MSISSNHLGNTRLNLRAMFSITFSSMPDEDIDFMKSALRSLRFFPLSVRASSSVSSGITRAVESMS